VTWLWLNIPLMVLFAAAVVGIPLWLVLRRPDFGPEPASRPGEVPASVAAHYARPVARSAASARLEARPLAKSVASARPETHRARTPDDAWRYGWAGR
jgi:hypothetical protein